MPAKQSYKSPVLVLHSSLVLLFVQQAGVIIDKRRYTGWVSCLGYSCPEGGHIPAMVYTGHVASRLLLEYVIHGMADMSFAQVLLGEGMSSLGRAYAYRV